MKNITDWGPEVELSKLNDWLITCQNDWRRRRYDDFSQWNAYKKNRPSDKFQIPGSPKFSDPEIPGLSRTQSWDFGINKIYLFNGLFSTFKIILCIYSFFDAFLSPQWWGGRGPSCSGSRADMRSYLVSVTERCSKVLQSFVHYYYYRKKRFRWRNVKRLQGTLQTLKTVTKRECDAKWEQSICQMRSWAELSRSGKLQLNSKQFRLQLTSKGRQWR